MSETIYVVKGHAGLYNDEVSWVARAFRLKEEADVYALEMERLTTTLIKKAMSDGIREDEGEIRRLTVFFQKYDDILAEIRRSDPNCRKLDRYGTNYSVTSVELW